MITYTAPPEIIWPDKDEKRLPDFQKMLPMWEEIGTYSMDEYTRIPDHEKSAGRLPRDFNKHDYPVKFVFNNNCGEFVIPTANAEYDKEGKEGYYFHRWHGGSPVVFTKAFSDKRVASRVTAYRKI